MSDIINQALALGCSRAKLIPADQIQVKDELAQLCQPDSCEEYGLAPTCPPHIAGPAGFRHLQQLCQQALVLRIDVFEQDLLGAQRTTIFRNLQEIVARMEVNALGSGYSAAHGFAGGSCKRLFCADEAHCTVLTQKAPCRFPDRARPSMSGFGIDLLALMQSCDWPATFIDSNNPQDHERRSWVAALILLAGRPTPLTTENSP